MDKMQRKRKYREQAWKALPKEEKAAIEAAPRRRREHPKQSKNIEKDGENITKHQQ